MGISIDIWRGRIGLFHRNLKLKTRPLQDSQGSAWIAVGKFHFYVLLICLIIGNVETNPGPTFKCHGCNFTASSLQSVISHFKFHTNEKNFQLSCPHPFCLSVCKTMRGLSLHVNEMHSGEVDTSSSSSAQQVLPSTSSIICQVPECLENFSSVPLLCHHYLNDHIVKNQHAVPCPLVKKCSSAVLYSLRTTLASHLSIKHKGWNKEGDTPLTAVNHVITFPIDCCSGEDQSVSGDFVGTVDANEDVSMEEESTESFSDLFFKHIAKFYLMLEAEYVLAKTTVQAVSEGLQIMSELIQYNLKESLQQALRDCNLPEDKLISVMNTVCLSDVFYAAHHKESPGPTFSNQYFRDAYMEENFSYIAPEEVPLDEDRLDGATVQLVKPSLTLELLFKDKSVQKHIVESFSLKSTPGKYENYTDGEVCKQRPSYLERRLDLIFFGDACTLTSHTKRHKIHGTYFTIGNLKPHLRSKLDSIHMATLVKEELLRDVNYGPSKCFRPLMKDLKKLESNGIKFMDMTLPVRVQFWVSDSEGAHQMGGFTGNFSGEYFCRFCEITRDAFRMSPHEVLPLRTKNTYEAAIAGLAVVQQTRPRIVTHIGVKSDSILNELSEFHVTDPSLPPCLAHDLFEGVLDWDLSEIISNLVEKNWFSYPSLKRLIQGFKCVGSDSSNKPSAAVAPDSLSGHAVQNWTLLRLLPFILESKIKDTTDKHWQLYLQLKQVVAYACNPSFSENDRVTFKQLLVSYMQSRVALLQSQLKPKHHFLMHYSDLVALLGPLIHLFTLRFDLFVFLVLFSTFLKKIFLDFSILFFCSFSRFEAKHQFFKRIAQACKNFINICCTLAKRHQIYLSYLSSGVIYPDGVGPNKPCPFDLNTCDEKERSILMQIGSITKSYKSLAYNDVTFKTGEYILANDLNSIQHIKLLVSSFSDVYLIVQQFEINFWDEYGVYSIDTESESSIKAVSISSVSQTPHPIYSFKDKLCFSPKYPIKKTM